MLSSIKRERLKEYLDLHKRTLAGENETLAEPEEVYCKPGTRGAGGYCLCEQAVAQNEGTWRRPICYEGQCYNHQAYQSCIGKENEFAFGDGTWCWNEERSTSCPASNGVVCPAGDRASGGKCECEQAVGYYEGTWRSPWCYEGVCYTGQAHAQCMGAENGHSLGDGTWCWGQERNTRCPTSGNDDDEDSDEDESPEDDKSDAVECLWEISTALQDGPDYSHLQNGSIANDACDILILDHREFFCSCMEEVNKELTADMADEVLAAHTHAINIEQLAREADVCCSPATPVSTTAEPYSTDLDIEERKILKMLRYLKNN